MISAQTQDWGLIRYESALAKQLLLQRRMIHDKMEGIPTLLHYLVFCEHDPVYTMGNRARAEDILYTAQQLEEAQIKVFKIKRGGEVTFHGPGQLVLYPIVDLERIFTDIHRFLRFLEEAVINTLATFDIHAHRLKGFTGVWVGGENNVSVQKICAMGIHCSRWVTMHGLALNVNTDLNYFDHIVPCGIEDKGVTSMAEQLGRPVDMTLVKSILTRQIGRQFGFTLELPV